MYMSLRKVWGSDSPVISRRGVFWEILMRCRYRAIAYLPGSFFFPDLSGAQRYMSPRRLWLPDLSGISRRGLRCVFRYRRIADFPDRLYFPDFGRPEARPAFLGAAALRVGSRACGAFLHPRYPGRAYVIRAFLGADALPMSFRFAACLCRPAYSGAQRNAPRSWTRPPFD